MTVSLDAPGGSRAATGISRSFLCGASTASHQVEGGNCFSDWWEYEQDGRLPFRSGDACRHAELYCEDFDLARQLGHNAHRFSLEWSRIEPERGVWRRDGLDHYLRVIDALLERGMEPVVTLHHFTNPAWFTRAGGWASSSSVDCFRRYVEFVAPALVGRARLVLTLNEPTVFIKRAYVTGDWPPCRPHSWREAFVALRNQCRAHVAAYRVLHEAGSDFKVGIAHSAPFVQALDPDRLADRLVASARDFVLNDLCFRLMGSRPSEVLDFIGINYYTRQLVSWRFGGAATILGAEVKDAQPDGPRRFNAMNWEVYPPGLQLVLRRFSKYGVPLIVSENGIATDDERARESFLREHLDALDAARSEGLPIEGYFYWSLMDNFEWTEGFAPRFGLASVDFATQRRSPRPVAQILKDFCDIQCARSAVT